MESVYYTEKHRANHADCSINRQPSKALQPRKTVRPDLRLVRMKWLAALLLLASASASCLAAASEADAEDMCTMDEDCSMHGKCDLSTCTCVCDGGHGGPNCQISSPTSAPSPRGATCLQDSDCGSLVAGNICSMTTFSCVCGPGWGGTNCKTSVSSSELGVRES